ncbi:MAG: cyclase family protein [bacterium]|nr:cyclase family protein [bacterium]
MTPGQSDDHAFDDEPFDLEAVANGAWLPGPYGPDDQRGTWNEITPQKTAASLARLDFTRPVETYDLSETLFNGFPANGDREYEQTLSVLGFTPPDDFEGLCPDTEPLGPWLGCALEERVSYTYNMGTKINGLHHVGIAGKFYNGVAGADISRTWGTTRLGQETQGPIVTRGVLIDVLGHKVAAGEEADLERLSNGRPMLREGYRITLEDIEATLEWEGVTDPIGPGDVILLRSGWRELIDLDPTRYLEGRQPGPFLRECRWLAAKRPAIICVDSWFFGTGFDDLPRTMLCHQEVAVHYGVRVGEAVRADGLAEDGVYDFVFCFGSSNARGAVSSNTPPIALGQPAL